MTTKTYTLTLKSITISRAMSQGTTAFTAKIYVDGKLAGDVRNQGFGGGDMVHWKDRALGKSVADALVQSDGGAMMNAHIRGPILLELAFETLLDQYQERQWFKSQGRTKTLFREPDSADGDWMTIKGKIDPTRRAWVLKKYPSAEFAADAIDAGAPSLIFTRVGAVSAGASA